MNLGEVIHQKIDRDPSLSKTGNHFLNVNIDSAHTVNDIDYQAKQIPRILENSIFIGYATRVLLHRTTLTVKSRLTN